MTDSLADLARLRGRRAAVVGGGFGIGRAVARMFAGEHVDIAVIDLDPERVRTSVTELMSIGVRAVGIAADVTADGAAASAIDQSATELGPLDILVNIVGRGVPSSALELTADTQAAAIRINYLHHVECSTAFARHCVAEGRSGSVTLVSSLAGVIPFPAQVAYGAAKAALNSFVSAAAIEWAKYQIRVNAVAPGVVITDRNPHVDDADRFGSAIPLGRLGTQMDVAKAVLFLASDLSSYVTGQTLIVDGGAHQYTQFWGV